MVEVGRGGTDQARFEREVIYDTVRQPARPSSSWATPSLCFGRIDRVAERRAATRELLHRPGRGLRRATRSPSVVDWRAPVAEPFYRATGREPMGLARRRHFATRGRQLLGIEDELFGDALDGLGCRRHGERRSPARAR